MFKSIKREPCFVEMQTADGWESAVKSNDSYTTGAGYVQYKNGDVILVETKKPVERIRLRWNDDFSFVIRVLGDAPGVELGDMAWMPVCPEKYWAWYIQCYDGKTAHGYGVKTGCNSFCFWQLDQEGISLVLDVRNGGSGVMLKQPLLCASIVEREGKLTETPYKACQQFCKVMCEKPNLPSRPVFGLNNWYYAYGNISEESVLEDTRVAMELCRDTKHRPYMLIDDGWQLLRERGRYIGGPFVPNEKFGDMAELASKMTDMGVEPGLWVRPLLTKEKVSESMLHPRRLGVGGGVFLDPSKDEVLEFVADIIKTVSNNGYKIIKYDFTAPDMMTADIYDEIYLKDKLTDSGWHFDDTSVTNAQIIKKLYEKVQEAAGDSLVMGCNTYNHLAAGIHQIQRSCLDTSGYFWEQTRKNGVNPLAFRMPQNNTFFIADPDCASISERTPQEMNVRFFEACAMSGESLFISVTPGLLNDEHKKRIQEGFKMADAGCQCEPVDWIDTSCPRQYMVNGEIKTFNWYDITNGVNIYARR
ncbi:MAG: hypothetical protein IJC06_04575 [Clostridia bacterium]|nr:hypothetical protein [Clostridia bacterium]